MRVFFALLIVIGFAENCAAGGETELKLRRLAKETVANWECSTISKRMLDEAKAEVFFTTGLNKARSFFELFNATKPHNNFFKDPELFIYFSQDKFPTTDFLLGSMWREISGDISRSLIEDIVEKQTSKSTVSRIDYADAESVEFAKHRYRQHNCDLLD